MSTTTAKKKSEKDEGAVYGVVPLGWHWTVKRFSDNDPFLASKGMTLKEATKKATMLNLSGRKARADHYRKCRKVFDEKAPHEFERPEGMVCNPLYMPGDKVYVLITSDAVDFENMCVDKGIITDVSWNSDVKAWQYLVWRKVRATKHEREQGKPAWIPSQLHVFEKSLYPVSLKELAREDCINRIADIGKWWSEFFDKLKNLKAGCLKKGEWLK